MLKRIRDFYYKNPTGPVGRAEGAGVQMGAVLFTVGAVALVVVLLIAAL